MFKNKRPGTSHSYSKWDTGMRVHRTAMWRHIGLYKEGDEQG